MPRQPATAPGGGDLPVEVRAGEHPLDRIGRRGGVEARAHVRGQRLPGIDERSRSLDQPAGRRVDRHIVAAEVCVELRLPREAVGVPSLDVVVDRHLRVEVGQVEELVAAVPHAARGSLLRDVEAEVERELDRAAGRHGARRPDEQPGRADLVSRALVVVLEGVDLGASDGDPLELDAARDLFLTAPRRAGRMEVLDQLNDEGVERVGRIVPIRDPGRAVEPPPLGVDPHVDVVLGPLLPVARPGGAVGAARAALDGRAVAGRDVEGVGDRPLERRRLRRWRGCLRPRAGGAARRARRGQEDEENREPAHAGTSG